MIACSGRTAYRPKGSKQESCIQAGCVFTLDPRLSERYWITEAFNANTSSTVSSWCEPRSTQSSNRLEHISSVLTMY